MAQKQSFKIILCLFTSIGIWGTVFAEPVVKYSEVEFDLTQVSIAQLGALGLPVDHHDADGKTLTMPISQFDIVSLKAQRIPFTLRINDYADFIEQRNIREAKETALKAQNEPVLNVPKNFNHGTMGGYLTLTEILLEIDEMRTKFPGLISAKFVIGTSNENRPIYAVRISNTPDQEPPGKRRIVYNTLTHPREPMAVMSMMWYLWTLLENYNIDPAIKSCLDNVEMYYIPVVNPDGFEYNRSTNPNGGGLWRKNRATNSDGTRGVDLNRNYSVNWGDNAGSSGTTTADTYRGPSAFSEPETKAVRDFYLAKKFLISSNYHTYANKILHPYGITGVPTNVAQYEALCKEMSRVNGWQYGRLPTTIGYSAAGVEIDWAHDIGKTLGVNPEQGTTGDGGFWPPDNRIDAMAAGALDMNMAMCRFAQTLTPTPVTPGRTVTSNFFANATLANGQWNFKYQLSDSKGPWFLSIHDLQGKQIKRFELSPSENSVTLSQNEIPRSMYFLQVKSCSDGNCKSVYRQKITMGGY